MLFNSKTFTQYSVSPDSATYMGPAHSVSMTDLLRLVRVNPVPQKGFLGVSRREAALTRTMALSQGGSHPNKLGINGSIAVGTSSADVDTLIADFRGFVASAAFADFIKTGKIYEDNV